LRIYEVRLNEILNYKQMLVGVSCIYAVISCKNYEYEQRTFKINMDANRNSDMAITIYKNVL
jgi:23S rRNA A1618 N6-methylase RlmF